MSYGFEQGPLGGKTLRLDVTGVAQRIVVPAAMAGMRVRALYEADTPGTAGYAAILFGDGTVVVNLPDATSQDAPAAEVVTPGAGNGMSLKNGEKSPPFEMPTAAFPTLPKNATHMSYIATGAGTIVLELIEG